MAGNLSASGNVSQPFDADQLFSAWKVMGGEDGFEGMAEVFRNMGSFLLEAIIIALRFSMWYVMAILLFVEAPQQVLQQPKRRRDSNAGQDEAESESESEDVPTTTITSSLRATARLLYGVGGILAFWRGFAITIPATIARAPVALPLELVPSLLYWVLPWLKPRGRTSRAVVKFVWESVTYVASMTSIATFGVAFTHIVITKPSFKVWVRRLPPLRSIVHVWKPAAIEAVAWCAVHSLPGLLYTLFNVESFTKVVTTNPAGEPSTQYIKDPLTWRGSVLACAIWLLAQYLRFKFHLPLRMALVRVEASMLPDDQEPIVPMNRYFTGSAVSGILSQSRVLTFHEAWKTVRRSDRRRAFVFFIKFVLIEEAIRACFAVFLGWDALKMGDYWNPKL